MSAEVSPAAAPHIGYSVVVPVYKNEESLPEVVERLEWLQTRLPEPLEAVFVVDGSRDAGPILVQEALPVLPSEDEAALTARIHALEHRLLPRAVRIALSGGKFSTRCIQRQSSFSS